MERFLIFDWFQPRFPLEAQWNAFSFDPSIERVPTVIENNHGMLVFTAYIQNKIALVNFKKKMAVDREKRSSLLSI